MGPEPMCSKYNKVNIGGVFYRTRDGDNGKVTTQCFVRASFPKNDADADDEWEDRYGIINAILRVSIGGVLYTFLKCDWLPVPTEAQIASFKLKNSILGVDKVSKAYYTFNPWDTSKYTMDNREPYLLANQVQAQVVIVKHPCMDSAVILDTSDRNMEKLALVDRPVGSDGHFDTCGKCRVGGELLLCERAGCKEAMHYAGSTPGTAAAVGVPGDDKADRDDVLEKLLSRLDKIEASTKTQRMGAGNGVRRAPRRPLLPAGGRQEEYTSEVLHTLALCQVCQAAADSGKEAFAAAVEQHGAPAVVKVGAASGGVDISAYGLYICGHRVRRLEDDEMDVQEELRQLRSRIDPQLQVVPRHGGAAAAVSGAPTGFAARITVPTVEFPGGVDLVPVQHTVPSVTLGAPISDVNFSLEPAKESFAEHGEESESLSIDYLFMESEEEEEFPPSIYDESFVRAPAGGASAARSQQVVGCGAPPFGLRPNFIMLACRVGLLCFSIAGVTAGLDGVIDTNDGNSVTEDPPKASNIGRCRKKHAVEDNWFNVVFPPGSLEHTIGNN
ncbi:hypothetical protein CYMTET_53384 [Cymbomonas tetramitiformis]|uniref:Uncharacterized protein n=1 Tax=Cymbomonas tetramitiformis TaxID=36881 RepID=A0AAE0EQN4_9CHLO|nr:hypothetical protein CYMTET_53384 [Cymbomonas tetramitiformis]